MNTATTDFFGSVGGPAVSFGSPMELRRRITPKMIAIAILIVIIIAVIVYIYFKPARREVLKMGPYYLEFKRDSTKDPQKHWEFLLNSDEVTKMIGNNITMSFFVYMDEISVERIPVGSPEYYKIQYFAILGGSVAIQLDPIHQKAIVTIFPTPTAKKQFEKTVVEVKDVYVNKWNQITLTVEGRTVDIYMNGHLATSTLLDNVPWTQFSGLWLNTSPDFAGQTGMFQIWPERRTAVQILENYKRNTDVRGKPLIPDPAPKLKDMLSNFCKVTGICGFSLQTGPMEYIDYEFA